ncbi:hypothetical protein [Streptomyces sp. NPDC003710]
MRSGLASSHPVTGRSPSGDQRVALSPLSGTLVQSFGRPPAGGSRGGEFGIAFFQPSGELDVALFHSGDRALEFVDVAEGFETPLAPDLLSQRFGQPLLQLLDAGGKASVAGRPAEGLREESVRRDGHD